MRKLVLLPLVTAVVAAGCGGDDDATGNSTIPSVSLGPTTTFAPTPEVSLPDEAPEQLEITDLEVGTGPEAKKGDAVVVHYVGVRTEDGTEFDSNFDQAEGFIVTLGAGGVIKGWQRGLEGIQAGGVRQLDIPNRLAYGDQPQGEIIKAGDDLSFVIQADSVVTPPDQTELKDQIEASDGAAETTTVDLVEGTGAEATTGSTVRLHLIAIRGDNKVVLTNTWDTGQPERIVLSEEEGAALPGLVEGITGMKVGGRRVITMPPEDAFGPDGQPQLGLPRDTDFIVVADVLGVS